MNSVEIEGDLIFLFRLRHRECVSRQPLLRLTGCVAAVSVALCGSSCARSSADPALKSVRIYDLLVALPNATPHVHTPSYSQGGEYSVANETRSALFLHPTGSVDFPVVHLSSKAVFTFWIGIDESAWDKSGDGVEFTVFVRRANDARAKVFSRYLDPHHNPDDRRWVEGRVSLKDFRNEDVQIVLATGPGPTNDFNFDWAVWGEPQIILSDDPDPGSP